MSKKTEEQVITTKEKETILHASPEKLAPTSILTISADADIETPESIEDTNWHELQNAYRTKKNPHRHTRRYRKAGERWNNSDCLL